MEVSKVKAIVLNLIGVDSIHLDLTVHDVGDSIIMIFIGSLEVLMQ